MGEVTSSRYRPPFMEHRPHAESCAGGFFVYEVNLPHIPQTRPLFFSAIALSLTQVTIITEPSSLVSTNCPAAHVSAPQTVWHHLGRHQSQWARLLFGTRCLECTSLPVALHLSSSPIPSGKSSLTLWPGQILWPHTQRSFRSLSSALIPPMTPADPVAQSRGSCSVLSDG